MSGVTKVAIAFTLAVGALTWAWSSPRTVPAVQGTQTVSPAEVNQDWMLEGEKRYRINCGRCHQAPHKFSPRATAMIVRHMRVRAMLTDDDMKYLLYYMSH
jgi:cytochrome c5